MFALPLSNEKLGYSASVELPNQGGVIGSKVYGSYDEALFAAEELINSWNARSDPCMTKELHLKPMSEKVTVELSVREAYMLLSLLKERSKDGAMEAWSNVNRVLEKAIAHE